MSKYIKNKILFLALIIFINPVLAAEDNKEINKNKDIPSPGTNRGHQETLKNANQLVKQGKYQEALQAYDLAIKYKPDFEAALYGRIKALERLGKRQEADKSEQFHENKKVK